MVWLADSTNGYLLTGLVPTPLQAHSGVRHWYDFINLSLEQFADGAPAGSGSSRHSGGAGGARVVPHVYHMGVTWVHIRECTKMAKK